MNKSLTLIGVFALAAAVATCFTKPSRKLINAPVAGSFTNSLSEKNFDQVCESVLDRVRTLPHKSSAEREILQSVDIVEDRFGWNAASILIERIVSETVSNRLSSTLQRFQEKRDAQYTAMLENATAGPLFN